MLKLLDPLDFDSTDAASVTRAAWLIDEMERQDRVKTLSEELNYHVTCVGSTDVKFGNEHMKLAVESREQLFAARFPWLNSGRKTVAKEMQQTWERAHGGSLDDPRVRKVVDDTAAALYRRAEEVQKSRAATYTTKRRKRK